MTEGDRKTDYVSAYKTAESQWSDFLEEADTDMQLYCSAQFSEAEHEWAKRSNRSLYVFNRVRRSVNLVSGYEIRNRHILKIGPTGRDDDSVAQQHTGLIMQQMAAADGYDWLSLCFKYGSLISGSNLLEIYRDRRGQVQFGRRWHNAFLLDPMLTRTDLSDCGHILTGQWLRQDKCIELVPEEYNGRSIRKIPIQGGPNRWSSLPHKPTSDDKNPLRMYEEFWERSTDFTPMAIDRWTGEQQPWSDFLKRVGGADRAKFALQNIRLPNGAPAISRFNEPVRKVTLTIYVDGEEIWHGKNPTGLDDYNFIWLCGDFMPEMDRSELKLQSFSRVSADPQRARNRRMNQILDMMESRIQAGRIFRENALVDPKQAYKSGQDVTLEVKDSGANRATPLDDIFKQISAPDVPAGMFQLLQVLETEDVKASGLNEEIMGSDDKDIPGILHSYRTGQALTGLQGLFTTFRQAKRRLGRLMVRMNQLNMKKEQVQRIINEMPSPEFYAPDLVRFDCEPIEGLLTDSQQHLWYLELKQLRSEFPDMAQYIPASMLLAAAPVQYKRELMAQIQRAEQQQAQAAQSQQQQQDMMNRLLMAQTQADIARATEDVADAGLTRAKTVTEMAKTGSDANMDMIDRILRYLEIQIQAAKVKQDARTVQKGTGK